MSWTLRVKPLGVSRQKLPIACAASTSLSTLPTLIRAITSLSLTQRKLLSRAIKLKTKSIIVTRNIPAA
ncbi:UNVERIFIED_CONTAM: hypothetical protein GTU68_043000 [Idotea baltica]|nr:hypothetical protein [Idotea baltica]